MAIDRKGITLAVGDTVVLNEAMAVHGCRIGVIRNIDGEYIDVFIPGIDVVVERYGSELRKSL